jgi:hypothetical protein
MPLLASVSDSYPSYRGMRRVSCLKDFFNMPENEDRNLGKCEVKIYWKKATLGLGIVGTGIANASIYLIVTGYLLFHARAVETGLIFLWNLESVAVASPQPPFLHIASFALWSLLSFWLMVRVSARFSATAGRAFLLTTASVIVLTAFAFMVILDYPIASFLSDTDPALLRSLKTGALSPVSMVMAAGLTVFAFSAPSTRAGAGRTEKAASEIDTDAVTSS